MKTHYLTAALLSGTSVLALATGVYAQAPAADTTGAAAAVQEIVVTGSRVIANGNNSPTPVTVIPTQQMMDLQPTTVSDALNELPEFVGSQTQESNPGPSANNAGASYLSLRNLGTTRTLILYDGQRMPPTAGNGSVDVNQIPQLLLQRVDVVTGGASAVYGSDAVAGVVNFITDTKFNGLKLNLRTGVSNYGDDHTFDGSFAVGETILGGKGHVEISYEYLDDPGIMSKLSRPWGQEVIGSAGTGTAANPYVQFDNQRLSNTSFSGVILNNAGASVPTAAQPYAGLEFNQNGVLTPFVHGTATGTPNFEIGGDGGYYNTASLKSANVMHQFFARGDYDFTDNIHAYVQAAGSIIFNQDRHQDNEVRGVGNFGVLGFNNAFLSQAVFPATVQVGNATVADPNPYNAASTGTFQYGKIMLQAPTFQPQTRENDYMLMGGLDGKLADYKWEVGFEHTYGVQHESIAGNLNSGRLLAAENAVINPATGQVVCHAALVNPTYANCVPLNLFGPTSESAAAINYILATTEYWARQQFDDAHGSFTGAPFSTWAGPVNMSVSAEWRNLRYNLVSNAQPSDHPDCNGIQFDCTSATPLWITNVTANRTPVSQSVWEVAYETDIPLAKNLPFMQSFDLNGAIRYTNYSNSGGVDTWKIGVDWHVVDDLTLRATRSRDIRAPNLNELFAPVGFSPNGYVDQHTGVSQQAFVYSQGNANLQPEVADTTTAGFVWKPSFIPRFSLSVDAYRITLNGAITSVSGQTAAVQALCEASNGTSIYCSLYQRPLPFSNHTVANFPTAVYGESLNIAYIDTYGADFEANYATHIFGHNSTFRSFVTYSPHEVYNLGPAGVIDMGDAANGQGNPDPSWKVTAIGNFDITDKFKFQLEERWRDSLKRSGTSMYVFAQPTVPSTEYTDVNFSYDMKSDFGTTQIYFNIKNLFNTPPVPYSNPANTVPGLFGGYVLGDDDIGRYFTLGVHFRH